jgi:hypothetical protein
VYPAWLKYPVWPQQGPWTLPMVVDLTQDKDEELVVAIIRV